MFAEFGQAGGAVLPRVKPLPCRVEVGEVTIVEVGRVQAEFGKSCVEVLQVQLIQRHELTAPVADRLHRRLIRRAPCVGERYGVKVDPVALGEGGDVAGHSRAPVHDAAERVKQNGLDHTPCGW